EDAADGGRGADRAGPGELAEVAALHRDEDEPGPKLRDAELAGVQQLPVSVVAHVVERVQDGLPVRSEAYGGEALDVLQHDGGRACLTNEPDGFREQVALVVGAELL